MRSNQTASEWNVHSFGIQSKPRDEERMMLEEFGDEYATYIAKTKRLVPGIW